MNIILPRAMGKHILVENDTHAVLYPPKDTSTKPTGTPIVWNDLTMDIDGANYILSSSYRHRKAGIFHRKESNAQ